MAAVQFCSPISQLSTCVAAKARPAAGPASSASWPMKPSKCRRMASALNLSHSGPSPASGAGWFTRPVAAWPMRRMIQRPAGASHATRPPVAFVVRSRTCASATAGSAPGAGAGKARTLMSR